MPNNIDFKDSQVGAARGSTITTGYSIQTTATILLKWVPGYSLSGHGITSTTLMSSKVEKHVRGGHSSAHKNKAILNKV